MSSSPHVVPEDKWEEGRRKKGGRGNDTSNLVPPVPATREPCNQRRADESAAFLPREYVCFSEDLYHYEVVCEGGGRRRPPLHAHIRRTLVVRLAGTVPDVIFDC